MWLVRTAMPRVELAPSMFEKHLVYNISNKNVQQITVRKISINIEEFDLHLYKYSQLLKHKVRNERDS